MSFRSLLNQLKYLYNTSSTIIDEFGIKYFLNFGLLQFKKQKLELLKSHDETFDDILYDPKIESKDQYALWRKNHENIFSVDDKQNFPTLNFSPTIHIFMIIDKKSSQKSIEESIDSIKNQNYSYWKLSVFTTDLQTINLVTNLATPDFENKINAHLVENDDFLTKSTDFPIAGDYVYFLTGNIKLEKIALYYTAKSLNSDSFDLLYSDEEKLDTKTNQAKPFFKPDWSPYLFFNFNYIGNSFLISKNILDKIRPIRGLVNGDFFDLLHKAVEFSDKIHHIPLVLFRDILCTPDLILHKDVISESLKRKKINATPEINPDFNSIKVNYDLKVKPKVSIIIPTKDNKDLLFKCIQSLEYNTNYENLEIIVINNNSQNDETKSYLSSLPYLVINYNDEFNFSKINNLAVSKSTGDYLLFLNDDTESLNPNWLNEMVSVCNQKDVGIVGAKLLYHDNTIQHAGMVFLKTGYFFHPFQNKPSNNNDFFGFINSLRETSSVTGACMLIKKNLFEDIGKFNELFDVYYGDSDLCFKTREHGFKVIYNPYAVLRHDSSSKIKEIAKIYIPVENFADFNKIWPLIKKGDPYYNPNLSLDYNIEYT